MRFSRVLAIAQKNLRSLKHDRRTIGFLVLMPLLMITIFGYTFGGDVKDIDVYIVTHDRAPAGTSISQAIIADLKTRDTLNIVKLPATSDVDSPQQEYRLAIERLNQTKVWAVIIFSENFTESVTEASAPGGTGSAMIWLMADGTNPNIVQAIVNDLLLSVRAVLGERELVVPITVFPVLVYGEGARFIDFFAPGVMGLAAMMVTFMLSIISFVHERSASTLDRLLSTPVTEGEIVAGYALAFGLVGLIQSCVIMTAAIVLFDVMIVGNILLALLVIFLLGVGMQGLGFLLSSVAKSEFQAIQFLPLILFPSILLSGVFWPIEAVPELLRPVSSFIPLTYAVEGMRSVMIRGWSVDGIWPELLILMAFAAATLVLSTYGLRRRR